MFISLVMSDGATAIINPAHITHITPSDPAYAEDGSVIHFVSDRAIQVREEVSSLREMLSAETREPTSGPGGAPFLIRG